MDSKNSILRFWSFIIRRLLNILTWSHSLHKLLLTTIENKSTTVFMSTPSTQHSLTIVIASFTWKLLENRIWSALLLCFVYLYSTHTCWISDNRIQASYWISQTNPRWRRNILFRCQQAATLLRILVSLISNYFCFFIKLLCVIRRKDIRCCKWNFLSVPFSFEAHSQHNLCCMCKAEVKAHRRRRPQGTFRLGLFGIVWRIEAVRRLNQGYNSQSQRFKRIALLREDRCLPGILVACGIVVSLAMIILRKSANGPFESSSFWNFLCNVMGFLVICSMTPMEKVAIMFLSLSR